MSDTDEPGAELPEATDAEALASALLDGEAEATDEARAVDPDVVAARAAFERVAGAVAAPVAVDEEERERAIAAAIAAWPNAAASPVDELATRRRARRGLAIAGIAAAVLGVVGLAGIAAVSDGESGEDTAAVATDADSFESEVAEEGGGTAAGSVGAGAPAFVADLGAYDDVDALVAAADAGAERAIGSPTTIGVASDDAAVEESTALPSAAAGTAADSAGCAPPAPPPGAVLSTATATLEGQPVTVVVVDGDDGRVVQVYDRATCETVFVGPPG